MKTTQTASPFPCEYNCFKYLQDICIFVPYLSWFLQLKIVHRVKSCWFVWLSLIDAVLCGVLTWQAAIFKLVCSKTVTHPPQIFLFEAPSPIIWNVKGICDQTSNVYCLWIWGIPGWHEEWESGVVTIEIVALNSVVGQ